MPSNVRTNLLVLLLTFLIYGSANAYQHQQCVNAILNEENNIKQLSNFSSDLSNISLQVLHTGKECTTCEPQAYQIDFVVDHYDNAHFLATLIETKSIVNRKPSLNLIDIKLQTYQRLVKMRHELILKMYGIEKIDGAKNKIDEATKLISKHLDNISACAK